MTIGARPGGDALAREVARAKITGALFGIDERVLIGRYQLLARAGSGGMGVVWSAWDPELERRIAIKLVRFASPAAREQMLREGQALAKLSHPNVVPIYDVGTVGDQVYLVMEWIAGNTLRELGRVSAAIAIERYRAAGAGLVAAHRVGIVHRDFKPDNVMVGDDGRVRVVDFGLARAESATATGGTPRYMAPEQAEGRAVTAAADQYSFCVALGEAFGTPPAWIAAIVARGTAAEPGARFLDLATLLGALDHDPRRTWRRRGLAVGVLAAAATAFALGGMQRTEPVACSGAGAELADVWNPARAVALSAHATTLGTYGESEGSALALRFAGYGERWVQARRGACLAHRRDELTPQLYERGLACLERARAALDATAGALGRTSVSDLPAAVLAAHELPDIEACVATTAAAAATPYTTSVVHAALDADLTRATYLALATDPQALPLARSVARVVEGTGDRALIARGRLALGAALAANPPTRGAALGAFGDAADAALAAGADEVFVEAFARELYAAIQTDASKLPALEAMIGFVETIAKRSGTPGRFARALFYNNAGSARLAAGDRDGAIAWLRKASAEPEAGDRGVELWTIPGNLAMLVSDRDERAALFATERTRLERALGPDHAFTLQARMLAADFVDDARAAAAALREPCARYTALYPHRDDRIGACQYELGWLAAARGDDGEARQTFARAAAQAHFDDAPLARAELARLSGDDHAAIRQASELAQRAEAATAWWERFSAVDAWLVVAAARAHLGDQARAATALRASLAVFADPRLPQAPHVERRRARVQTELARLHPVVRDEPLAAAAITE